MIYFVRHGLSKANVDKVFAGQKDNSPLVEKGFEQAREAGRKIIEMNLKIDRIVCSPLLRTKQTVSEIADVIGFNKDKIIYDDRIMEYDMGALSGTPHHEVTSFELVNAEGAEDPNNFRDRIVGCVQQYIREPGTTLLVSHGGVGRMLETIRENKKSETFYDNPIWQNAAVVLLDWIKAVNK